MAPEFSESSIFQRRDALLFDFTPVQLPHRETELNELMMRFKPVVTGEGVSRLHLTGDVGTGKTVLSKRFGEQAIREGNRAGRKVRFIHINMAYMPKPYHVVGRIANEVLSDDKARSGLSAEEMLLTIARTLRGEGGHLIVCLDEVDAYVGEGRDRRIFYMLSRFHELTPDTKPPPRISLIYICRSLEWLKRLDTPTLDTLGRVSRLELRKYAPDELKDILWYRTQEAFKPTAISEGVVEFIRDIAEANGGVRYGLELLLESGAAAEVDLVKSVKPEHVRRAHFNIPKWMGGGVLGEELSLHGNLLLAAVAMCVSRAGEAYAAWDDVYDSYRCVCEEYGVEPDSYSQARSELMDLGQHGYVLARLKGKRVLLSTELPSDVILKITKEALKAWRQSDAR
ncbi:MAG: Cdc6/Cdc18 family protein [Candidatus Bathyarchaeia archaeon]